MANCFRVVRRASVSQYNGLNGASNEALYQRGPSFLGNGMLLPRGRRGYRDAVEAGNTKGLGRSRASRLDDAGCRPERSTGAHVGGRVLRHSEYNLRSYPVYVPGREPHGYWEMLQRVGPQDDFTIEEEGRPHGGQHVYDFHVRRKRCVRLPEEAQCGEREQETTS